jgi:hypothetical protein
VPYLSPDYYHLIQKGLNWPVRHVAQYKENKYMKSMSLEDFQKTIESKYLAKRTSRIVHLQSSIGGWTPSEGSNSDPNNHGDITTTPDAVTATVADLTTVFETLDHLTRQAVIDSFVKAHAAASSIPTNQKFSRKKK